MKQPAALPLSLPSRERHGSRQPPEPVGLSQHRVSVLLKPVSEIRLTGNTFLCKSAVSPACHATEQPGPAVQRPKPSPSWSIKRCCLGSIPEQAFWHPQCRSWLPPAPPCDRGLQTLYSPFSAAGTCGEFSLLPLPSRPTCMPGCYPRMGFPVPRQTTCVMAPREGERRCHLRVPPSLGKGLPFP